MLRGNNNLFRTTKYCGTYLTNYVSVRWKSKPRKPFWLGIAKTKLFVIPEKKVEPPEEVAEMDRLQYIYARQMRALQNFMKIHSHQDIEKKDIVISDVKKEARLLHERWNSESARLREERLKKEEEETVEKILNTVLEKQQMQKEIELKVKTIVEREINISDTFITAENLDNAIDECLAQVIDYNYALDLSGNIYKGDSMTPTGKIKLVGSSVEIQEIIPPGSRSKEEEESKVI